LSKRINDGSKKKDIKIIIVIAIIFVVAFVLIRVVLSDILLNPFYVVASGSMVPVLNVNDLIVVWGKDNKTSFDSTKVGDIIVFKAAAPWEQNKTIVHRVAAVFEEGDILRGNNELNRLCQQIPIPNIPLDNKMLLTQGDANGCSIPGVDIPITQENYIGKVVYTVPQIGIIPTILKPPVNYIIMAIIGGLLVASFVKSNKKQEEKAKDE
jgi:signal peptidase